MTKTQEKLLWWVGLPVVTFVFFLFVLQWSFPYERLLQVADERAGKDMDIGYVRVSPSLLPGGFSVKGLSIDKREGGKTTSVIFDEVDIDGSLLSAIAGNVDVDVEMDARGSTVLSNVSLSKEKLELSIKGDKVDPEGIPGLTNFAGLPIFGKLDLDVEIDIPREGNKLLLSKLDGEIELGCPDCILGDGETAVELPESPRGPKLSAEERRLTLPPMELGTLAGRILFKEGRGEIDSFGGESVDGSLVVEGTIVLADKLGKSEVDQCIKYNVKEDAIRKKPKGEALLLMLSGTPAQDDGFRHLKWKGTMERARRRPMREGRPCVVGNAGRTKKPPFASKPPGGGKAATKSERPTFRETVSKTQQAKEEKEENPAAATGDNGENKRPPLAERRAAAEERRTEKARKGNGFLKDVGREVDEDDRGPGEDDETDDLRRDDGEEDEAVDDRGDPEDEPAPDDDEIIVE